MAMLLYLLITALINLQPEPPKKCNIFQVQNDKSGHENFVLAKQVIVDLGVEIVNSDPDVYQIKTGYIRDKRSSITYYLISCRDHLIKIKGFILILDPTWARISNKGQKDSNFNLAFEQMHDIASLMCIEGCNLNCLIE